MRRAAREFPAMDRPQVCLRRVCVALPIGNAPAPPRWRAWCERHSLGPGSAVMNMGVHAACVYVQRRTLTSFSVNIVTCSDVRTIMSVAAAWARLLDAMLPRVFGFLPARPVARRCTGRKESNRLRLSFRQRSRTQEQVCTGLYLSLKVYTGVKYCLDTSVEYCRGQYLLYRNK